ncbi:four helix bundle protein [Candidatus Desantisbacteria bacterium CG_4_10_14_0_8_um_filter_48_22]|uniref:Four helix bundle protein n=1 Tax=Candidatus Desantisbacteria bacterium CG_4_10_14_0_8_um_filter_48_22 TaxID=1974543 RepID=A0A2M7S4J7_9BACT|nr:MAG: four helix bundle protein [Candidatus Desantisbacteria bacterium CG02_land_8_20_14_3_00_49_13]PIZ14462.1 MAG: four helix bundle protein [Candidatus Desantisbacteria bacterium CG_4_10_14_0_8_um_filter_48_22]
MTAKSYKDLDIWNKGIEIVESIYSLTMNFPSEEKFGLVAQMRRASSSVPSNIAEGFRRKYNTEFAQFLYIALGSCAELETQIIISGRLNFLSDQNKDALLEEIDHLGRMIRNFIKKL